jgi:hypothetical protein
MARAVQAAAAALRRVHRDMHRRAAGQPLRPGAGAAPPRLAPNSDALWAAEPGRQPPPRPCPDARQAAWYLKCRALTLKNWIDDTEIEEEARRAD